MKLSATFSLCIFYELCPDLVEHRLRSRRSGMLEMIPRPSLSDVVIPRFSEMIDLSSPHHLPMSESSESVRLGEGSVGPNATANEEKDGIPPSLARLLRLLPPGNQYDGECRCHIHLW